MRSSYASFFCCPPWTASEKEKDGITAKLIPSWCFGSMGSEVQILSSRPNFKGLRATVTPFPFESCPHLSTAAQINPAKRTSTRAERSLSRVVMSGPFWLQQRPGDRRRHPDYASSLASSVDQPGPSPAKTLLGRNEYMATTPESVQWPR